MWAGHTIRTYLYTPSITLALSVDLNLVGQAQGQTIVAPCSTKEGSNTRRSCTVVKLTLRTLRTPPIYHLEVEVANTLLEILAVDTVWRTDRLAESGRIHDESVVTCTNTEGCSSAALWASHKASRLKLLVPVITNTL